MHAVVAAARRYVGVRFRHQGRSEQIGLDCLGLLMLVARDLGLHSRSKERPLLGTLDRNDYSLLPDGGCLKAMLDEHLTPLRVTELAEGDVLLLTLDGNPQHLAIASTLADGRSGIIHAYRQAGKVVEHQFASPWTDSVAAAYRLP